MPDGRLYGRSSLSEITKDRLAAAQKAAIAASWKFAAGGKKVRYIRSVFVPGDSRCMCLFEASSPEVVEEVNRAAKIPFHRVVPAEDLNP